jgi:hypothetical protein
MKVYIIREEGELKIITVQPPQETDFLREYAGKIIAQGSSIQEVLIRFGELVNGAL